MSALPTGKRVEVFYDGDCSLCMREIRMLQRLDAKRQRIQFTNIAAPTFSAASYGTTMRGNAALAADIQGGLSWMYANRYNESKVQYDNWFHWEIGAPLQIGLSSSMSTLA